MLYRQYTAIDLSPQHLPTRFFWQKPNKPNKPKNNTQTTPRRKKRLQQFSKAGAQHHQLYSRPPPSTGVKPSKNKNKKALRIVSNHRYHRNKQQNVPRRLATVVMLHQHLERLIELERQQAASRQPFFFVSTHSRKDSGSSSRARVCCVAGSSPENLALENAQHTPNPIKNTHKTR